MLKIQLLLIGNRLSKFFSDWDSQSPGRYISIIEMDMSSNLARGFPVGKIAEKAVYLQTVYLTILPTGFVSNKGYTWYYV